MKHRVSYQLRPSMAKGAIKRLQKRQVRKKSKLLKNPQKPAKLRKNPQNPTKKIKFFRILKINLKHIKIMLTLKDLKPKCWTHQPEPRCFNIQLTPLPSNQRVKNQ
jgi:hypothetical protein